MTPETASFLRRALLVGASVTALAGAVACDVVQEIIESAEAPTASLARVDLVDNPNLDTLMAWGCHEYLGGTTCSLLGVGDAPSNKQLRFSFDVVFDLINPNTAFPIPLVETLLGVNVFEGTNLGVICVSFCDPDDLECEPSRDAEGSCQVDGSTELLGAEDLVPTVEQLVDIATDVATGTLDDNWDYRVIPASTQASCDAGACDGYTEAHLQFDFDVNAMMGLLGPLVEDGVNDLLEGRNVSVSVPYSLEGTLFFDVPEMGRYNVGYGPFDDRWDIE